MQKRRRSLSNRQTEFGTTLRHAADRLDSWKRDRESIASMLDAVISAARQMRAELGSGAAPTGAARIDVGLKRKGGRPKGYKTTPATRAKLRAAWKRRKAAMAAAKGNG